MKKQVLKIAKNLAALVSSGKIDHNKSSTLSNENRGKFGLIPAKLIADLATDIKRAFNRIESEN